MRIFYVHNYYRSCIPSGENSVVDAEIEMLRAHGHEVIVFSRTNDAIRKVPALGPFLSLLSIMANPFAANSLGREIRRSRPDIVHVHNLFPLISPLALWVAHRSGAKVVLTLHNYRCVCAAGTPMRGNRVCDDCFRTMAADIGKRRRLSVWPAIKYRCHRGSLIATVPLAVNIWLYRRFWRKWVDRFIVLSEFQRQIMAECGFPLEKLAVKGNFTRMKCSSGVPAQKKDQLLYVGRLSDEKGLRTLLAGWRQFAAHFQSATLVIAGDGCQREEYEAMAKGLHVSFLGMRTHDEVLQLMAESRATVLPSECWETFGMTVLESMQMGTPVIVSNLGALPSLVPCGCGEVFAAGDATGLAEAIERMWMREDSVEMSENCVRRANELYSEDANYQFQMRLYESVVAGRNRDKKS